MGYKYRKFLKKWVVDHVHDEFTGDKIAVSVDPESGTFWATYPEGGTIEGDSQRQCVDRVKAAIKANNSLDWKQVITFKAEGFEPSSAHAPRVIVGINNLRRAERASADTIDEHTDRPRQVARWRKHRDDWASKHDEQPNPAYSPTYDSVVLPYTLELWGTLQGLRASLVEAQNRLRALLGNPEKQRGAFVFDTDVIVTNLQAIATAPALALTGPTDKEEPRRKKAPPPPLRRS